MILLQICKSKKNGSAGSDKSGRRNFQEVKGYRILMEIVVFYDGTCPFCVTSARNLKKLDWLNKLKIIDLFTPGILEIYDVPLEEAMNRIQVVKNHKIRREGMNALLLISWYLPLLWIFIPFFWLSIKLRIGSKIYDWIARNRFLFPVPGYCPIPDSKDNQQK